MRDYRISSSWTYSIAKKKLKYRTVTVPYLERTKSVQDCNASEPSLGRTQRGGAVRCGPVLVPCGARLRVCIVRAAHLRTPCS
jgi:hypothetical protein